MTAERETREDLVWTEHPHGTRLAHAPPFHLSVRREAGYRDPARRKGRHEWWRLIVRLRLPGWPEMETGSGWTTAAEAMAEGERLVREAREALRG